VGETKLKSSGRISSIKARSIRYLYKTIPEVRELTVFCELGKDICISNQLFVAIIARVSRNRIDIFVNFLVVDFHLKHTHQENSRRA
jgi:hypothetical protein